MWRPVAAPPLPVGSLVAAGVTRERRTWTPRNSCAAGQCGAEQLCSASSRPGASWIAAVGQGHRGRPGGQRGGRGASQAGSAP